MTRTLTMDEAKARPIDELLLEVVRSDSVVRVDLPEGGVVEIRSVAGLPPLIQLDGCVPPGWKDAIYAPRR